MEFFFMTHGKVRKNRSINLEEKIFYIPLDNTI